MKATIKDVDILKSIQLQQVVKHLQANGWRKKMQIAEQASIWMQRNDSGEEFQIVLPLNPEMQDFPLSMSIALETLEIAERRSQLDILSDLITTVPNIEIRGIVTEVKAEIHQVTMMGVVVGKLRKMAIALSEPEYNLAVKAYQERSPVVCRGDLIKEGDSFWLKNPRNLALDLEN